MAIRYTPQPLKGKILPFWVWGVVLALTAFGLMFGTMLSARWIGMPAAVTATILIFVSTIVVHTRVKRTIASSLEASACPRCKQRRMHFKEENHSGHPRAYLICPDCGTKWDLGQV